MFSFRVKVNNRLNNFFPKQDVAPGTLLVASPALFSTPFRKAVVLIVQNNEEGTFGVVLNRPANEQIQFAWQELSGMNDDNPNLVQGGPIGGPVFALHLHSALAELEMPGGICITSQSEKFQQIVERGNSENEFSASIGEFEVSEPHDENSGGNSSKSNYRIVFGIAGWPKGQLISEVHNGLWYAMDGKPDQVFDKPEFMWEKLLRRHSRNMLRNVIGINQIPLDPLMN